MKKLKRSLNELFEIGRIFLDEIKPSERVLLIHHTDGDGICSAVLLMFGLKKLGIEIDKIFHTADMIISSKIKNEMKKADKIIITDVAVERIKHLPKEKKVLIFDHHPSKDVNGKNIVFINPKLEKSKIYQPSSYIIYKFFSKIIDMKKYEWVAVLGTVADFGFDDCKDLLRKHIHVKNKIEMKKTNFGKASDMFNSAISQLGINKSLKILISSNSINEILKNREINAAHKKFETKLGESKKDFWKNAEIHRDLFFYITKGGARRMGSSLASSISFKNPNKTIIVLTKGDGVYNVHARNQSGKVDVGKLLKKCCDIEGGGHKQAGGGRVKNLEKFRKCVLKNIKNFASKRS